MSLAADPFGSDLHSSTYRHAEPTWWDRLLASSGIGYAIPALMAFGISQTWFRPGLFIAAGDVAPFNRAGLASEFLSLWNHRQSGSGSTSYDIVRSVEVLMREIALRLGGSEFVAQRLLFGLAFGLAAIGSVFLARSFTSRPLVVVAVGLLGAFNPYVLVNLPNPLPVWTVGTLAFLVGFVLRAAYGKNPSVIGFALVSLLTSYVALNPALLAVTVGATLGTAIIASLIGGRRVARRVLLFLLKASPWVILINLWWLIPVGFFVLGGESGIQFAAITNVESWAWSHRDSSLINVLTLKATWGWEFSEYFPYASSMDQLPWRYLRFLLPVGALASPLLAEKDKRKAAWTLAALVPVVAFVAKGLHSPLGNVNLWLYDHVPGMWLLREPMSKVGPVLVLLYLALLAIGLDGVGSRFSRSAWRWSEAVAATAAIGVVGALAYPHPLWTGSVIPDDRGILPPAHVAVPDGWIEAAATVNASNAGGKALLLPLSSFYQMATTWGYHGADVTARQLIERPVIQLLPGGYFSDAPALEELVKDVEDALVRGRVDSVPRLLQSLGVSHVLVRRDLAPGTSGRDFEDFTALEAGLDETPGARLIASTRDVTVYEMGDPDGFVSVHSRVVSVSGAADSIASLVGSLTDHQVATADPEMSESPFAWTFNEPGGFVTVPRPLRAIIEFPDSETLAWEVRHTRGNVLEIVDPVRIMIDDQVLPGRTGTPLELLGEPIAVAVGDEYRLVKNGPALVHADRDMWLTVYGLAGPSVLGGFGGLEDCAAYDARSPEEAGLVLEVSEQGLVRLEAVAHSACVVTPVEGFDPAVAYRLEFDYRTLAGRPARACVWQEGPDRCAELPELESGDGWSSYEALVVPEEGTTGLRVFLYADGSDTETTTVAEYRNLTTTPEVPVTVVISEVAGGMAQNPLPSVSWRQIGPAGYSVDVEASDAPIFLVLHESYASGWELRGLPEGVGSRHFEADGYANGWKVGASDGLHLTLEYTPAVKARWALASSGATGVAALLVLVAGAIRGRRSKSAGGMGDSVEASSKDTGRQMGDAGR